MATIQQPSRQNTAQNTTPIKNVSTKNNSKEAGVLFTKENHKWMIISGAIMVLGLIVMIGGKSSDPTKFNYDEVYSLLRITIAPLLILGGLATFVYAILRKGEK
jgi:uncharacterized membrane-anchored protein